MEVVPLKRLTIPCRSNQGAILFNVLVSAAEPEREAARAILVKAKELEKKKKNPKRSCMEAKEK